MTRRVYVLPPELTHGVRVNMGTYWEYIAAFNSETVARRYAKDCQGNTTAWKYDVQPLQDQD